MAGRCSIVMEYENATSHDRDDAVALFAALARQFVDRPAGTADDRDELILVFDPAAEDGDEIEGVIDKAAPGLRDQVDCRKLSRPGLRYYELKNAGAEIAGREFLVFLDSDSVPEDNWLAALLEPFEDPRTIAVNGHTYLGHYDFVSRVFALTWIFPLRSDRPREIQRRSLNANNCAFRRQWFAAHNFPDHRGFKVSCSLLSAQMRETGTELVQAEAFVRHEPLEGWRFMLWRAVVAGRDDDARFATMRSPRRTQRVRRAVSRWLKQLLRSTRRILTQHRAVGMPVYEIPAAIAVAWFYYSTAFVSQLGSAVSGPREEPERVPEFVVRH